MPSITLQRTTAETVAAAVDKNGETLVPGDFVTITLKVVRIRQKLNPRTGKETGQDLEVGIAHVEEGSEYVENFATFDALFFEKVKSNGQPSA